MTKKTYYPYFDLLKFICCIGIVAIHINPFSQMPVANDYFSHLANIFIAIFFVVSSSILWKKIKWNDSDWNLILHFEKRLIILLFVWGVLLSWHWGVLFYHTYQDHGGTNLIGALFLRLMTSGTCLGSWFIVSLMWTIPVLYILNRYLNKHFVFFLVFLVWLYHSMVRYEGMPDFLNIYFFGEYYNGKSIDSSFLPVRAIFWLESGYYFMPYLEELLIVKNKKTYAIGVVLFCFALAGISHYYFISNAVISILLPALCLCLTGNYDDTLVTLREISIIVYFVHRPIYTAFEFLYKHSYLPCYDGMWLFLLGLLLSIIIGLIVVKLSKKYKVLRYLY